MEFKFILTDYIREAIALAVYEELEDGTFGASIPACVGVFALGNTQPECQEELRSVLEDWMLTGFKSGDELPVIAGIDLNFDMTPVPEEYW